MRTQANYTDAADHEPIATDQATIVDVRPLLSPEMFSDNGLAFIYRAFLTVYDRGERPDMVLVEEEMRKLDADLAAGMNGLSPVWDAMDRVRLEYNVVEYACEVRRLYTLRTLRVRFRAWAMVADQFATDPLELIRAAEEGLSLACEMSCETDPAVSLGQISAEVIELHRRRMDSKVDPMRIFSGIAELDALTGGLYRGEITVVVGETSSGKTAMSMFMAMNVAKAGYHVLHVSAEMTATQMMNRFVCDLGLAMHAAGLTHTVALCGVNLSDHHLAALLGEGVTSLLLFLDNDPAGHAATEKIAAPRLTTLRLDYGAEGEREGGKDADEIFRRLGPEALRALVTDASIPPALQQAEDDLLAACSARPATPCVSPDGSLRPFVDHIRTLLTYEDLWPLRATNRLALASLSCPEEGWAGEDPGRLVRDSQRVERLLLRYLELRLSDRVRHYAGVLRGQDAAARATTLALLQEDREYLRDISQRLGRR